MKYWRLYITLLLLALYTGYTTIPIKAPITEHIAFSEGILIAHAGGGLREGTYTNALEALDKAVENNFKYIEIDFSATKNDELILLHDWEENYFRLFSWFPRLPRVFQNDKFVRSKTASDFEALKMRGNLTPLSLESLIIWLSENSNVYIVTDIKDDNIKGLTQIRDQSKTLQGRFIPQIYSPSEYERVKNLGYENIILTTYKLAISAEDLGEFCKSNKLFALTMPQSWINNGIISRLPELDFPILTHTVNSTQKASQYITKGVGGVYTDYLYPEAP